MAQTIKQQGFTALADIFKKGNYFIELDSYSGKAEAIAVLEFKPSDESIDIFKKIKDRECFGDEDPIQYYVWGQQGGLKKLSIKQGESIALGLQKKYVREVTTKHSYAIRFLSHIAVATRTEDGINLVAYVLSSEQIYKFGESCAGTNPIVGDIQEYKTKLGTITYTIPQLTIRIKRKNNGGWA